MSVPRHFREGRNAIVRRKHGRLQGVRCGNGRCIVGSFRDPRLVGQFMCNVFHPSGTGHSCSRTRVLLGVNMNAPRPIKCVGVHSKLLFSGDCCVDLLSAYPCVCSGLFARRFSCTRRMFHTVNGIATHLRRRKCTRGSCKHTGVLFRGAPGNVAVRVISLGQVCVNPVSVGANYGGFRHLPTAPRVRQ